MKHGGLTHILSSGVLPSLGGGYEVGIIATTSANATRSGWANAVTEAILCFATLAELANPWNDHG
jgi:hypothetical protein